ncbi:MAG: hypothetical protein ABIF45_17350 [Pseudomonadota bacterium]
MAEGTMTIDVPASDTIDEVIGNVNVGGDVQTVRQPFTKLSEQLAGSGAVATAIEGAAAGLVETVTWAQLAAIAGTRAGQPGQAVGPDAGTHTDPVVGGTVANKGKYSWSIAPAGWRRIADYEAVTEAALALKAPLASPALTGTPTAPTAAAGTNTTQIATTAHVKAAIDALLAGAPGALDTLNELAAALGDDANFAATITTALALKAPLASPVLTGTPTAPTAAAGDNSTKLGTTEYVDRGLFEQTVAHVPGYGAAYPGPFVVASADGRRMQMPAMMEDYQSHEPAPAVLASANGFMISRLGYERKPPAVVNADQIRRIKQKLRMILRDPTQVCRIAYVGDSWFASAIPVWNRDRLVAQFGDAGPGWVNLSGANQNKCADGRVAVTETGTWTDQVGYEPTPSTTSSSTDDPAAYRTIVGVGPIATSWLHYVAAGGASAFYRWGTYNAGDRLLAASYTFGADQPLDLSTGYRIDMPTGRPSGLGSGGYWALQVGHAGGTIKVGGLDLRSGTGGVIVDSLAKGGSNTSFWLIPPAAAWQTAYGSLDLDGTFFLHGTNDQVGTDSDWQVAVNFDTFRQRHLAGARAADMIYLTPCENFLARPRLIKNISAAVREMALDTGVCHHDLQDLFGPLSRMWEYRHESLGGIRPLFKDDDVHPGDLTGMVAIAGANEELINV